MKCYGSPCSNGMCVCHVSFPGGYKWCTSYSIRTPGFPMAYNMMKYIFLCLFAHTYLHKSYRYMLIYNTLHSICHISMFQNVHLFYRVSLQSPFSIDLVVILSIITRLICSQSIHGIVSPVQSCKKLINFHQRLAIIPHSFYIMVKYAAKFVMSNLVHFLNGNAMLRLDIHKSDADWKLIVP